MSYWYQCGYGMENHHGNSNQWSMVVWPFSQSKGYTHDPMLWKSFFTIEYALEPMEIWPIGHETQILLHECNCMIQFGTTMWNTIYTHWWYWSSSHWHAIASWQIFSGMVDSTTCLIKNLVFYYRWCPTKTTVLQWVLLYFRILCTFSLVGIYIRLHFILLLCLEKKNSSKFFCAFYDCVEHQSCPDLCLASVESMVFIVYGENKRWKNEACNIWLPLLGDIHVHQPKGDHWIV